MENLVLHFPQQNYNGRKILLAANFLSINIAQYHLTYQETKKKQFIKNHPYGKIPFLTTNQGPIYQNNAILRHISRIGKALYGTSLIQTAFIDQWLDFCNLQLQPIIFQINQVTFGYKTVNKEQWKSLKHHLQKTLILVENHLKDKTYLVGQSVTLADIALIALLVNIWRFHFSEKWNKSFINLCRWFKCIQQTQPFKNTFGKVFIANFQWDPGFGQKTDQKKKEKKQVKCKHEKIQKVKKSEKTEKTEKTEKSEKTEKKQKKQKKEKQKKEQIEKEQQQEQQKYQQAGPKVEQIAYPETTFNINQFKMAIVNCKSQQRKQILEKYFWSKYDPNGWSIWKVQYQKCKGQGQKLFMTSNLKNGFLQRLDPFRKFCFATHGIYGNQPNLQIRGVWMWRGCELSPYMKNHPSFEYHKFIKLDINKEQDRKLIEDYWIYLQQGGSVQGLNVQDAKYFK